MKQGDLEIALVSRHAAVIRDWREWERKSLSLRRAALLLHEQVSLDWGIMEPHLGSGKSVDLGEAGIDLSAPRTMLNGLAIESLVKAIWVRHRDPIDPAGRFLIGHHRTFDLISELSISLYEEEEDLLHRLESYVVWAGKYPTSRRASELLPKVLQSGQKSAPAYSIHRLDEETFLCLYDRLRAILHEGIRGHSLRDADTEGVLSDE